MAHVEKKKEPSESDEWNQFEDKPAEEQSKYLKKVKAAEKTKKSEKKSKASEDLKIKTDQDDKESKSENLSDKALEKVENDL